jgi:hypothetical protein
MEFGYSTPALLFPTVSLLFLAYTTRFVTYANLVRGLHEKWRQDKTSVLEVQILNLRRRIRLIRNTQILGAVSLIACVLCMLMLFFKQILWAEVLFGAALAAMTGSLVLLVIEVSISTEALDAQLHDMEERPRRE